MLTRWFAERENQPSSVSGVAFSLASVAVVSVRLGSQQGQSKVIVKAHVGLQEPCEAAECNQR